MCWSWCLKAIEETFYHINTLWSILYMMDEIVSTWLTYWLIYLEYLDYGHNIMIVYFFQEQLLFIIANIIGQFSLMHAIYSCYFDSMTSHNILHSDRCQLLHLMPLIWMLSETKLFRILRAWMNSRLLHYVLLCLVFDQQTEYNIECGTCPYLVIFNHSKSEDIQKECLWKYFIIISMYENRSIS